MTTGATLGVFSWEGLAALFAVVTVTAGVVIWVLRWKLAEFFVTKDGHDALMKQIKADHAGLSTRLRAVEEQVSSSASARDMQAATQRLVAVEVLLAGNSEKITGAADGVRRVEHMMNLLLTHQLEKAK